jgi:hypothetical protein
MELDWPTKSPIEENSRPTLNRTEFSSQVRNLTLIDLDWPRLGTEPETGSNGHNHLPGNLLDNFLGQFRRLWQPEGTLIDRNRRLIEGIGIGQFSRPHLSKNIIVLTPHNRYIPI